MAKNMARIENGIIIGVEWCSDRVIDTETLISVYDRPVTIGDIYDGQDFYHDGEKILTPLEEAEKKNEELEIELAELDAALLEAQY
jgi:hypothetical protein